MKEFYVVRAATSYETWVDVMGNWNTDSLGGDPFKFRYHTDYPTKEEALVDVERLNGQLLVFSSEHPYPLIEAYPAQKD